MNWYTTISNFLIFLGDSFTIIFPWVFEVNLKSAILHAEYVSVLLCHFAWYVQFVTNICQFYIQTSDIVAILHNRDCFFE